MRKIRHRALRAGAKGKAEAHDNQQAQRADADYAHNIWHDPRPI
jgi:hypothetical protein